MILSIAAAFIISHVDVVLSTNVVFADDEYLNTSG